MYIYIYTLITCSNGVYLNDKYAIIYVSMYGSRYMCLVLWNKPNIQMDAYIYIYIYSYIYIYILYVIIYIIHGYESTTWRHRYPS